MFGWVDGNGVLQVGCHMLLLPTGLEASFSSLGVIGSDCTELSRVIQPELGQGLCFAL